MIEPDDYLPSFSGVPMEYYCVKFSMVFLLAFWQIYPEVQCLDLLFEPQSTLFKVSFKLSLFQGRRISGGANLKS